jgi:hypothetical protein
MKTSACVSGDWRREKIANIGERCRAEGYQMAADMAIHWRRTNHAASLCRWRSRVEKFITDSDGDRFLLLPLFDRTPVRRDIYC